MAILRGLEVTVLVGGKPLQEYDNKDGAFASRHENRAIEEHHESKRVSKYVEVVTGQEYVIYVEVQPGFKFNSPTLSFFLYVDGVHITDIILSKSEWVAAGDGLSDVIEGVKKTETDPLDPESQDCILRKFKFADIHRSE